MPAERPAPANAFQGTRASYVALAAISTLALALLTSIWEADVSGSTALLGLLAVYLSSPELLILYVVFTPASVVVDIIRLSVVSHSLGGRGWLIFFNILEMMAKGAGAVFAWSLHRSISAGSESILTAINGATRHDSYQRVDDPFAATYAPPRADVAVPVPTSTPASPTSTTHPPTSATYHHTSASYQPPSGTSLV